MTSTATPISAAAKQQQQNNNKDQFHRKSPLMVITSKRELTTVNYVPPSAADKLVNTAHFQTLLGQEN
jgi:hypothetical protein